MIRHVHQQLCYCLLHRNKTDSTQYKIYREHREAYKVLVICLVNKYNNLLHNYNIKSFILRQYNLDNNWHAAPAWRQHTITSIAHLQVVTLRKFTTHVEISKVLPECWHIFFPLYFTSNLRIYSRKIFFPRPMRRFSRTHLLLVGSCV